jgi:hypothetical protein
MKRVGLLPSYYPLSLGKNGHKEQNIRNGKKLNKPFTIESMI